MGRKNAGKRIYGTIVRKGPQHAGEDELDSKRGVDTERP